MVFDYNHWDVLFVPTGYSQEQEARLTALM